MYYNTTQTKMQMQFEIDEIARSEAHAKGIAGEPPAIRTERNARQRSASLLPT